MGCTCTIASGLFVVKTIAGGFNFSSNADKDNDENLRIVNDRAIAQFFRAESERVLALAKNPPKR